MRRKRSLREDVREGIGWGVYLAICYSAIAVLSYLATGGRSFSSRGVTLPGVLGAYALCALVSGTVAGVAKPLGGTWWGAALLGLLIALPTSFVISFLVIPRRDLELVPVVAVIFAVAAGPALGITLWRDKRRGRW